MKTIQAPLSKEDVMGLTVGETVLVNGTIYTARDAAHQRMAAAIEAGDKLPFDPQGQVIYYTGPSPAPPGKGNRFGGTDYLRSHGYLCATPD